MSGRYLRVSEDGLTLTVKLKDGLTFASGNKITSADVAFSINRTKNLKGNPSFICDTIESIETPDDATVIFHLNQPDSAILSKLTYSSLAVLDSAVVKEMAVLTQKMLLPLILHRVSLTMQVQEAVCTS